MPPLEPGTWKGRALKASLRWAENDTTHSSRAPSPLGIPHRQASQAPCFMPKAPRSVWWGSVGIKELVPLMGTQQKQSGNA